MAVAWGSRPAGGCLRNDSYKSVHATVRPAGARSFRPAVRVGASAALSCDPRTVGLVVTPDGRSTVAWST